MTGGRVAFVFPGLGSQRPGIGTDLAAAGADDVYRWASARLGWSVPALLDSPDLSEPDRSYDAQIALYCVSLAALRLLQRAGVHPDYVAGHSLGESAALAAAGVLTAEDGLRMVSSRAETMRRVVQAWHDRGSMVAILGLPLQTVERAVAETADGQVLVVANDNAPGNVVAAGELAALDRLVDRVHALGARKTIPLLVDCAFHSPLMAPVVSAVRPMILALPVRDAAVPMVSNQTARVCRSGERLRSLLASQLLEPVRWAESVEHLVELGVDTFVEVGPGTVLTGLIRRVAPDAEAFHAGNAAGVRRAVLELAGRRRRPA
jgi:[acyl-carrier-protein] S-malonyltransferase